MITRTHLEISSSQTASLNLPITLKNNILYLKQGDVLAYTWLYDEYSSILFGIITRTVKDRAVAHGLLQDTFLDIREKIGEFDIERGTFVSWLIAIARNRACEYRRAHESNPRDLTLNREIFSGVTFNTPETCCTEEQQKAIQNLEAHHRQLLDLIYLKGYSPQETANIMNITLETLRQKLRSAFHNLKMIMEK